MGRFLSRMLDVIFPGRVYRRDKLAEMEAGLRAINEKADKLKVMLTASESTRSRRHKATDEVLTKILVRLDEIAIKLESVEAKAAQPGKASNDVSQKQIVSEWLYGEHGDE